MAQNSFALLTNVGRAKEAAALANGTTIQITQIAIGDGATVPSGGETALYHQIAVKTISASGTVAGASNVAYFDAFLAAAEGPYTIREAGLIDSAGDLIAIAHYDPPINKPIPSSGQTVEGTIRLEVAFSDIANVTILVDTSMQVALQRLTTLPWIPVLSMTTTAPPASPAVGDTYLIPTGATGAWTGQAGRITEFTSAGWAIVTPKNGHGIGLPDGSVYTRISGTYVKRGQVEQAVARSGFTFAPSDQTLLAKAVRSQRMNYVSAGGTANALTVTLDPAPASFAEMDGLMLRLRLGFNNTGAATLKLNGLAEKPIVAPNGAAIREGDLVASALVTVIYSVVADAWCLLTSARAPSQAVGFAANTYAGGTLPSSVSTNVRFSNVVYDSSGAYSPATGIFSAPEAGAYIVTANFWFQDIAEATQVFIVQNGVSRAEAAAWTRGRVLAVSALLRCAKNDQIRVAVVQNNANPMTVPTGTFQHAFGASLIGSI